MTLCGCGEGVAKWTHATNGRARSLFFYLFYAFQRIHPRILLTKACLIHLKHNRTVVVRLHSRASFSGILVYTKVPHMDQVDRIARR